VRKARFLEKSPYAVIPCRAAAAGIETEIGNPTVQGTGITAYLKNGGTPEKAGAMAKSSASQFDFGHF
jgi:integrase/recombinase XerC